VKISAQMADASAFVLQGGFAEEFESALAARQGFFIRHDILAEKVGGLPVVDVHLAQLTLQLSRHVTVGGRTFVLTEWFVGNGDWSGWLRPIVSTPVYREVEILLRAGKDFRTTAHFQKLKLHMEMGRPPIRNEIPLDTLEKLETYAGNVLRLAASISKRGVLRRPEAHIEEIAANTDVARPLWVEAMESEIGAAILADGTVARLGPGHHRVAVAKLCGVSHAPVEIRLVHGAWLKRQMAETGLPPWPALIAGLRNITQSRDCPA
jgi:hypothetical protein